MVIAKGRSDPMEVPADVARRMRDAAVRAAREAGALQLERFRRKPGVEQVRPHDLKLEIDRLSEEAIVSVLSGAFPDHGILGEESGRRPGRSEYLWIIDPLDGSVNYHHGLPCFCVSLACHVLQPPEGPRSEAAGSALGEPVIGVVYAPVLDELYCGVRGRGATCNGQPISVGDEAAVEDAVIGISFGSREETMQRMCDMSASMVRDVRKLRIFGSTALDMVNVACGRMSALIQGRVRYWDFAGARPILEESGGVFRAREVDAEGWEIIACAPGLFPYLKDLVPA